MKKTVVIVSGGFDPLHSGHINYLESAARLGDKLIVALNSDKWLTRKKGRPFMEFEERACIIDRLDMVDNVWGFDDEDGSAKAALEQAKKAYPDYTIVFCNGGDRTEDNIPEMEVEGIQFAFGVGGTTKSNSSSWILKEWKYPTERRVWGEFSDLFHDDAVKVKELVIEPGKGISYQRHFKRSEVWFVSKGQCEIKYSASNPDNHTVFTLKTDESFTVRANEWHQVVNRSNEPCHIIEIQYGEETTEDDIERLYYYDGE
jgi:D-beta-D-heptose 7-phosphate kinase/D-beta-D-heptose 1-phosphate adenosyltransferase